MVEIKQYEQCSLMWLHQDEGSQLVEGAATFEMWVSAPCKLCVCKTMVMHMWETDYQNVAHVFSNIWEHLPASLHSLTNRLICVKTKGSSLEVHMRSVNL